MDLTEFLLARVAEDEAVAKAAVDTWDYYVNYDYGVDREHGERWSPAVVLAECEAKRRIVETHLLVPATNIWGEEIGGRGCPICDERADLTCGGYEIEPSEGCATLRLLALPYADHPDYRPEWALARV